MSGSRRARAIELLRKACASHYGFDAMQTDELLAAAGVRLAEADFEDGNVEVFVTRSELDNVIVVQIDGPREEADIRQGDGVPRMRVWLNEATLWDYERDE